MSRKPKEKKDIFKEEEIATENLIPEENVLSLRKKEWVIRIDPKQIKDFLYLHKHTLVFIFTFFATCAFIISTSSTNASVATFYPETCLGGWQNVENATGEPSVEDQERIESFTKENSAIFENSNEEIFCGDFKGLIPEDSEPKKFALSFHWSFDYGDIKHDDPLETNQEIDIKEENPSIDSVETIKEQDIEEDTKEEENPVENNQETKEEVIEIQDTKEETPVIEEVKTEETVSFLRKIFSTAHAQEEVAPESNTEVAPEEIQIEEIVEETPIIIEEIAEEAPVVVEESSVQEQTLETPEENNPVVENENSDQGEQATEDTSTFNVTTDGESKNSDEEIKEDEIETSPNDIFEVVYTLDGETWDVLGRVRKDKWQESTFEIPYEKITTWDDLSKLQIRLKILPSFDTMPVIYLDAISLSVEYVDSNIEIETIDFNNIMHTVQTPEMLVFLAKKDNKYGIWVLDKSVIGKPEESLRKLETVGVLPYEPVIKDGIIFWVVGDPQTVVEEVAENIVPDSVDEYLNSSDPQPEIENLEQPLENTETIETPVVDVIDNEIPSVVEEETEDNIEVDLPIETIDSLDIPEENTEGITEVLEGQSPTAIVGFREDLGYISQTILDTSNKDNWLKFGDYAVAWKDGSFVIFDMLASINSVFDSISINKNTPNILPKTYREWIVNIPDFEKDEKDLEVIDSEEPTGEESTGSETIEDLPIEINDQNTDSVDTETVDQIEVIDVDNTEEIQEVNSSDNEPATENSSPELSI